MPNRRLSIPPNPVIEAYKKDVDRTLIRQNLMRTVEERFRNAMALQRYAPVSKPLAL